MDWNRRWAKKHGKLSVFWHKAWFQKAVEISSLVAQKDIQHLTLWALSTENLKNRDTEELAGIIGLIELIPSLLPTFHKNKTSFHTIGDIEKFPTRTQEILKQVKEASKEYGEKKLILALVYGWQDEIIRGMKTFIQEKWDIATLNEENFYMYTDSGAYPPPDLIIRTGWDTRHSGFLLYASAYSEYFFSEKYWPDFDEIELEKALDFFMKSKRNFGK
jgi:undecaprenyl diphosphate synthase